MSQVREIMTWDMLGEATRALSQMVADDGYEPDMILGIARGGLLPAGAMGYALSIKNVSSTCRTARSWWSTMSPTPATR
jgi:hypoxanthine phosphoribosyltransferase